MLTTRFIAPYLHKFRERCPDIRLDLVCTNRELDLARREADIALRLARPDHDDLVVKKLFTIELGVYASTGYVERFGMPPATGDLGGHLVILFADAKAFRRENEWVEENLRNAQPIMRSDSVSSIYSAAVGGLGVSLLPSLVADSDARLVRIPLQGAPAPRSVWQAVHEDLQHSARIRAVLDFLGHLFTVRAGGPRPPAGTS